MPAVRRRLHGTAQAQVKSSPALPMIK